MPKVPVVAPSGEPQDSGTHVQGPPIPGRSLGKEGNDMMNYGYSNDYGWIIWLILGILVVAVAVYAFMRMDRDRNGRDGRYPPRQDRNDALEILKKRYANGEISEEEYEKMKKRLETRS